MMGLFDKDKDLIQRIINLILIIWLVAAIYALYSNFIDSVLKAPIYSYAEFEASDCNGDIKQIEISDEECANLYELHKITNENDAFRSKKSMINASGHVIIVGLSLYLINRKKRTKA